MLTESSQNEDTLTQILEELRAIRSCLEHIDTELDSQIVPTIGAIAVILKGIDDNVSRAVPGIGMIAASSGPIQLAVQSIEREMLGRITEGEKGIKSLLVDINRKLGSRI